VEENKLIEIVMYMVPVILSITVHEYAHALASYKLGDDTAAQMGRLTLNPIAHMDLFGTVIIPVIAIMSGAPFFGWAKPVPFNPLRFHRKVRMKTATMIVALAGPVSNMLLAMAMVVLGRVLFHGQDYVAIKGSGVFHLVLSVMVVNVSLSIFNLVPVPPLDGSKILYGILPDSAFPVIEFLEKYSFVLFIGLLLFGSGIVSLPINVVLAVFIGLMGLGPAVGF
jgi:Zn-dependent protease